MPLSPHAFLALAAACAPGVAPETLLAVSRVESGLNPLAIGVNGGKGLAPRPASRDEAIRTAEALVASGRNVDLGLAQINVRNLGWLGLTVASAFDPCANLAASARVLTDGYRRAGPQPGREQISLRVALSYYNTGTPDRGFNNGYVARVLAAHGVVPPSAARASQSTAPDRLWTGADADFVIYPKAGGQP